MRQMAYQSVGLWLPFGLLGLSPTMLSFQFIDVASKPPQGDVG